MPLRAVVVSLDDADPTCSLAHISGWARWCLAAILRARFGVPAARRELGIQPHAADARAALAAVSALARDVAPDSFWPRSFHTGRYSMWQGD